MLRSLPAGKLLCIGKAEYNRSGAFCITTSLPPYTVRHSLNIRSYCIQTWSLAASTIASTVAMSVCMRVCMCGEEKPPNLLDKKMHGSLHVFQHKLPRAVAGSPPIQSLCPDVTTAVTAASLEIPRKRERKWTERNRKRKERKERGQLGTFDMWREREGEVRETKRERRGQDKREGGREGGRERGMEGGRDKRSERKRTKREKERPNSPFIANLDVIGGQSLEEILTDNINV